MKGEVDEWTACLVFMAYFKIMFLKKVNAARSVENTLEFDEGKEYGLDLNKLMGLSNLK
jgi:hypothetical protein